VLSVASRYVLVVSIVGRVAPERTPMSASARGTASNYSKGIRLRPADLVSDPRLLAAVAVVGAVLLVAAELSPLYTIVVGALETPRRSVSAGSHHGYALAVVALAAMVMAAGALRGARAAAVALVVLGAVALLVAFVIDLPETRGTGTLREAVTFSDARLKPGRALALEIAGAAALLGAGGALLAAGGGVSRGRRSSRPDAAPRPARPATSPRR